MVNHRPEGLSGARSLGVGLRRLAVIVTFPAVLGTPLDGMSFFDLDSGAFLRGGGRSLAIVTVGACHPIGDVMTGDGDAAIIVP
jgi:hypothetical protein